MPKKKGKKPVSRDSVTGPKRHSQVNPRKSVRKLVRDARKKQQEKEWREREAALTPEQKLARKDKRLRAKKSQKQKDNALKSRIKQNKLAKKRVLEKENTLPAKLKKFESQRPAKRRKLDDAGVAVPLTEEGEVLAKKEESSSSE